MTFKEFMAWYYDQTYDGFWNLREVAEVVNIIADVRKKLPWRREKYWKKQYESRVMQKIVIPIKKRKKIIEESLRKEQNK